MSHSFHLRIDEAPVTANLTKLSPQFCPYWDCFIVRHPVVEEAGIAMPWLVALYTELVTYRGLSNELEFRAYATFRVACPATFRLSGE